MMIKENYAELITAVSTFATAVVVIWQAYNSRGRLEIDIKPIYKPAFEVEFYNIGDRRITVRYLEFVFRKKRALLPYKRLKPHDFEPFSVEGGHKESQTYNLTIPMNSERAKDYNWNDIKYVKAVLSDGKKFKGFFSVLMKKVLSANEDYFHGSHWHGYMTEDYGRFMKNKVGAFD